MKNIHILPKLVLNLGQLFLEQEYSTSKGESLNHNIYITSDEEIKEGDWVIKKYETKFPESKTNEVLQVNKINTNNGYLPNGNYYNFSNYLTVVVYDRPFQGSNDNDISRKSFNNGFKKIILTTDQDLIKDGVQAIYDDFLEWFVKNPSCERVEVESKVTKDGVWTDLKGYVELPTTHSITHKIIIPKEELCTCTDECMYYLSKQCKHLKEEPKQETLEDFAVKFSEWVESLRSSEIDTIDYDLYLRYNTEELLEIYKKEIK